MLGAPSHLLPPFPYSIAHNINVVEGAELELGGGRTPPYFKPGHLVFSVYVISSVREIVQQLKKRKSRYFRF